MYIFTQKKKFEFISQMLIKSFWVVILFLFVVCYNFLQKLYITEGFYHMTIVGIWIETKIALVNCFSF